jgi:DNA-binding IclR family transcriptional regulator
VNLNRAELLDLLEGFVRHGLIRRVGRNRYYTIPSTVGSAVS